MRTGKRNSFFFIFLLSTFVTSAQQQRSLPVREPDYSKPLLFADLPDTIACDINSLSSLLTLTEGRQVEKEIAGNFRFKGDVTSFSKRENDHITGVTLRSSNYEGAILNLVKITGPGKEIRYTGRIVSLTHGDALELIKEGNQYYFIKKGFYDMINE